MSIITSTFDIFHEWAALEGIRYTVLRNYEDLPDVGNDLDLAFETSSLELFRKAIQEDLFKDWEFITEVNTHNSKIERLNISIFRFYNLSKNEFVQFDFFQGFSVVGQGFFDINDMLNDSREFRGYNIVSPDVENLIKYLQVYNAIINKQFDRVMKYGSLLINNGQCKYLDRLSLSDEYLRDVLVKQEFELFRAAVFKARKGFLKQKVLKEPFSFISGIFFKVLYFVRIYISHPFSVNVYFSEDIDRNSVLNGLSVLVKNKMIRNYLFLDDTFKINKANMKKWMNIRSHGGIIVKFSVRGEEMRNESEILNHLYLSLVNSEVIVYRKCL